MRAALKTWSSNGLLKVTAVLTVELATSRCTSTSYLVKRTVVSRNVISLMDHDPLQPTGIRMNQGIVTLDTCPLI